MGGLDAALGKLVGDASDFLDGPSDQILVPRIVGFFGLMCFPNCCQSEVESGASSAGVNAGR